MDSADSQLTSSFTASTIVHATSDTRTTTPPAKSVHSKRYSEPGTSRQQRLLHSRNARFPAKKLSLSNLSTNSSQVINANEDFDLADASFADQENIPLSSNGQRALKRSRHSTNSLGILDETTGTAQARALRKSAEISIYQDTPERPQLPRSPYSSPAIYQDSLSQNCSPFSPDHTQESPGKMRLREISGNEYRGSVFTTSPLNGSMKSMRKRKSFQIKAGFDTEEYIEHIEKQLEEVKNELYSPTTNKALKTKLNNAQQENEKLKQDIANMRDIFEVEVKRSIERKAEIEVELKRKVKDLEDELEQKVSVIHDLELQHDEKRLDSNTIDTLKATIEKLEQDKSSLQDENRSVSKRNEVLSELLAMSPTKMQSFELRSPVREKRAHGRPMSMIIPRLPSSPTGRQISQAASAIVSPSLLVSGSFSSLQRSRINSPQGSVNGSNIVNNERFDSMIAQFSENTTDYFGPSTTTKVGSRRSTLQSQFSANDASSVASSEISPVDHTSQRLPPKRKPRKFMAGSTQLKPLLLPALTGDNLPLSASSVASSPQIGPRDDTSFDSIDPTTYFISQPRANLQHGFLLEPNELLVYDDARNSDAILNLPDTGGSTVALDSTGHPSQQVESAPLSTPPLFETMRRGSNAATEHLYRSIKTASSELTDSIPCENEKWPGLVESELDEVSSPEGPNQLEYNPVGLDLVALNHLRFPDPNYDALPDRCIDADEDTISDVPEPLFSLPPPPLGLRQRGKSASKHAEHRRTKERNHSTQLSGHCPQNLDAIDVPTSQSRSCQDISIMSDSTLRRTSVNGAASGNCFELPQRSTLRNRESAIKTKSPIHLLRPDKFGAQPLAAVTIRTIFGTISQCTSHIRDFKRDPLALARRVMMNAWFSNWSRFGRLSWWVLGLFVSTGVGGPKLRRWDWEDYDGEAIAGRTCHSAQRETSISHSSTGISSIHRRSQSEPVDNGLPSSAARPQKPGWGKSLLLWGKFSMAIMLAVGGAVVKGPGEMLKEIDGSENVSNTEHDFRLKRPSNLSDHRQSTENVNNMHQERSRERQTRNSYGGHPTSPLCMRVELSPPAETSSLSNHKVEPGGRYQTLHRALRIATDDETLRAVRSPRKNVAEIFEQRPLNQSAATHEHLAHQIRLVDSEVESINSGASPWSSNSGLAQQVNTAQTYRYELT